MNNQDENLMLDEKSAMSDYRGKTTSLGIMASLQRRTHPRNEQAQFPASGSLKLSTENESRGGTGRLELGSPCYTRKVRLNFVLHIQSVITQCVS